MRLPVCRAVCASLFAVLAACGGSDDTIDIAFDPCDTLALRPVDATVEQAASIAAAAELWNSWGTRVELLDPLEVGELPGEWEIPVRFEAAAPQFHGVYRDEIGDLVINTSLLDGSERAVVIAHELGHAFALEHVEDYPSVMNRGNLERPPNATDAEDLWGSWPACVPAP
jgi:hypothetical protein